MSLNEFELTFSAGLPVVTTIIAGCKSSRTVRLVFDTGAFRTQIHMGVLNSVGYSFVARHPDLSIQGVSEHCDGYSQVVDQVHVLGRKFLEPSIAAVDFSEWSDDRIDGLLGIDLIQCLNFRFRGAERKIIIE